MKGHRLIRAGALDTQPHFSLTGRETEAGKTDTQVEHDKFTFFRSVVAGLEHQAKGQLLSDPELLRNWLLPPASS